MFKYVIRRSGNVPLVRIIGWFPSLFIPISHSLVECSFKNRLWRTSFLGAIEENSCTHQKGGRISQRIWLDAYSTDHH